MFQDVGVLLGFLVFEMCLVSLVNLISWREILVMALVLISFVTVVQMLDLPLHMNSQST